ncbi:NUDIX domain-containing protein [Inediibacterium massiliense]|uniref:NUDIX domain-containing protein n=1 Tax=Inediibacterium massiliense TaxID=1658111 RepID=UPI0006B5C97E|nr:NUDIX domain-containing protein [Inediibacterium massiliense]
MEIFKDCCAIAVVKDEKILLGFRKDGQGWSMAGGKLEKGENYEMAARRELKEEFNLVAHELDELGHIESRAYVRGEEKRVSPKVFLCKNFSGDEKPQDDEMKELRWFSLQELKELSLFLPSKEVINQYKKSIFSL